MTTADSACLVKFLGLLGPQGALPLATTEEAYGWNLMRDDAFPRFLDILNHRFLQLFFRAWSDARPIGQHDRPDSRPVRHLCGRDDRDRLGALPRPRFGARRRQADAFAGLMAPQAKSASRLREPRRPACSASTVEIDEFVGSRLVFEESERTRLGRRNSGLGTDILVGAQRVQRAGQVPRPHLR